MDRQARKLQAQREETSEKKTSTPTPTSTSTAEDSKDKVDNKVENSSGNNKNNSGATPSAPVVAETPISDDEDMVTGDASKPRCSNCGILCHVTHATTKGEMCGTCHQVCFFFSQYDF